MLNPKDKRIRLVLMMPLLFAGGIAGCSHQSAESAEGAGKSADTATPVALTRVTRADIHRTVTVTGSIAALPNQDVRVSSFVAGRIAELKVAEGDHVRSGQIVARLEDHTLRDQLKQAEAAVAQARANLENAKLSRTRNETLFQRGIAARKDLEDARTQESGDPLASGWHGGQTICKCWRTSGWHGRTADRRNRPPCRGRTPGQRSVGFSWISQSRTGALSLHRNPGSRQHSGPRCRHLASRGRCHELRHGSHSHFESVRRLAPRHVPKRANGG